jgi:hypothetical protein
MTAKLDYLVRELGVLAWAASVQRASLYKRGVKPGSNEVKKFRRDVAKYIFETLLPKYKKLVDEEQHYKNLDALITHANRARATVLSARGYKYGVAQKLLNLTLKYHWCLELLEEPPHCPVDRIVINKTKLRGMLNWTEIIDRADYEKVINEIRQLAGRQKLSISAWELTCYSRR